MRKAAGWTVLVALLSFGGGCMGSTAKQRFANEYGCPQSQVTSTSLGGGGYRVTGCGQTTTYTCIQQANSMTVTCVHDNK